MLGLPVDGLDEIAGKLWAVYEAIQPLGSVVPVCQTLAESVLPTTLKRNIYDVPVVAVNARLASLVRVPLTFF